MSLVGLSMNTETQQQHRSNMAVEGTAKSCAFGSLATLGRPSLLRWGFFETLNGNGILYDAPSNYRPLHNLRGHSRWFARLLGAAFAPEIASMRLSASDKAINIEQLLTSAFPKHAAAVEEFSFYVPCTRLEHQGRVSRGA